MRAVTYGSVCSGIEAATVAWHVLGWRAVWFAEIEKYPSTVLAHHYPRVPNMGDMTKLPALVRARLVAAPDILVGGTPCQAYSLAGLRGGLTDPRGQLTLTFVDLANAIDEQRIDDECVVYWENVPGVLSDKTNAFGCLLAGLAGETEPLVAAGGKWPNAGLVVGPQRSIAWRVTDAQYFGVAQRRRRLFLVASARTGFDPGKLLFEFDGVRRDTAPGRETKEDLAGALTSSLGRRRGQPDCGSTPGHLQPVGYSPEIARCIATREGTSQDYESTTMVVSPVCPTLRAGGNSSGGDRPPGTDVDTATSLVAVCIHADAIGRTGEALTPSADASGSVRLRNPGLGILDDGTSYNLTASGQPHAVCVTSPVTHTLKAEGFDASEDGTGRGQPIIAFHTNAQPDQMRFDPAVSATLMVGQSAGVAYAFSCKDSGADASLNIAPTMRAMGHAGSHQNGGGQLAVCAPPVWRVRRLTPRECERLQSFPDDYTLVPVGRKLAADGPRYKALGNSMCVYNMRWLGLRLIFTHPTLFNR